MKKLAVAALEKNTITNLKNDLNYIFRDVIEIDWYFLEDDHLDSSINANLILFTSPIYYYMARDIISSVADVIIMNRTISREGYQKLMNLKDKKEAMLVNRTLEMAVETISQIRALGIRHINLVPVYPQMAKVPELDTAITPDHVSSVPQNVKHIVNIGNRKLDISTIMDITAKLDININEIQDRLNDYVRQIVPISTGLNRAIKMKNEVEKALEIILSINDKAILIADINSILLKKNEAADNIFELSDSKTIKKQIYEILDFPHVLNTGETKKDFMITYNDKNIIVSNYPIIFNSTLQGAIAVCEEFVDFERKHQKMKKKLIEKGHIAKYTFEDIISESSVMKSLKNKCRKISSIDSTAIILGESGTGKEMFSQAIHNNSIRKDGPFVAINCSNLSSNLLESELFGYEEGSFTGALKGGNKGLFEIAHGGTIFLDEIGEMPLNIQAKILRVLEEKEIRRLGGNRVINVDVRIIAATNKDLRDLVEKKLFRNDLYYRLSTFEVTIPALKERKNDIRILVDRFCRENQYFKNVPEDILLILESYHWPGNVRQLRNAVEYMVQMSEGIITISDLPDELVEYFRKNSVEGSSINHDTGELETLMKNDPYAGEILLYLLQSYYSMENKGRRSIAKDLNKRGVFITENEIRSILLKLEEMNLVQIKRGRSGTRLTKEGYEILKGWKG